VAVGGSGWLVAVAAQTGHTHTCIPNSNNSKQSATVYDAVGQSPPAS